MRLAGVEASGSTPAARGRSEPDTYQQQHAARRAATSEASTLELDNKPLESGGGETSQLQLPLSAATGMAPSVGGGSISGSRAASDTSPIAVPL